VGLCMTFCIVTCSCIEYVLTFVTLSVCHTALLVTLIGSDVDAAQNDDDDYDSDVMFCV